MRNTLRVPIRIIARFQFVVLVLLFIENRYRAVVENILIAKTNRYIL